MATETATAKDGQFILVALVPDVCLTPSKAGQPAPYPLTHTMDLSEQCSENVFFAGEPAYLHQVSYVDQVHGDEAGLGGGVVTQVNMEISHTQADQGSRSVFVNGCALIRTGDRVWMNQKKPA